MKKRFMFLTLLMVCFAALPLLANAESSGKCGDNVTWRLDDNGTLTISGTGKMYDYYGSGMDQPWISGDVKKIKIESGVTHIGSGAFSGIYNATSVTMANSVTSIGDCAFMHCTSLTSISLSSNLKTIGFTVFNHCAMTSIQLPNGLTTINGSSFGSCSNLTSITIPSSVTTMGGSVFYECSSLKTVTIQNGLTSIESWTFGGCPNLERITIPNSVTNISSTAFTDSNSHMTIVCYSGSEAHIFATNNGYPVVLMDVAPVITSHPSNVTVAEGKTASFSVKATNAVSYQWYYLAPGTDTWNGVSTNGKDATYSFTAQTRHNGYQYRCLVENEAGSAFSNIATLTVLFKPTITTQPTSATVVEGKTATFKVVASGATGYQWHYQKPGETTWNAVSNNGTSATYSLTTQAHHNGYKYRVKVSNNAGYIWSNTVTLTVVSKPVITSQPSNKTVNEGETVTFKVVVSGIGLSYQWNYQKPGETTWNVVSNNGTSASYILTTAAHHNGYKYRVKVSNAAGYVWSNTVTLTVITKPVITTQPANKKVNEGETATFKVVASGIGLSYQWNYQKPGETTWNAVSNNGTSATLSVTAAAHHNGYKYRVKVSNSAGSVWSNTVTLTVVTKPVITTQPANKKVNEGETATFKVVASGIGLSYQWNYQKSGETTWNAVSNNGTSA
ncbi:MAG: leucine-rich repeat protein, partial [Clostridia bacterium]|nr:leucine-rich repeat protein [Clostridia bacterium]